MPLPLPSWSQTKTTSKQGFDKVWHVVNKLEAPVNRLSNKLGSEAFWPTSIDKECDKAARILRSFCKDGFYVEDTEANVANGPKPKGKQRVIKKIPTEVIRRAKGLAIFTTMRTGLWVSGAGGSGILIARMANGEWSPPSGILLHTAGLGFLVGVDIYDCVVVINTDKALEAFTKIRCTLGGEVSAVAGPVGMGGVLETELHKRQAPVFNYLKSRGFYAGVQIDGTVIIERGDENERFYGERIPVADILTGKARHPPPEIKTLMATVKAAQGDTVDENALPAAEPTPGDYQVEEERPKAFGLPSEDDPDPFGVLALEQEGMEIREAGTRSRPTSEAFEYRPAPSSPIFTAFARQNSTAKRHQKRDSGRLSIASTDRGTQTELLESPRFLDSPKDFGAHSPVKKTTENLAEEVDDGDSGHDLEKNRVDHMTEAPVISKAKLVTIPRRIPPPLPPRSPYRSQPTINAANSTSPLGAEYAGSGLGIDILPPPDNELEQNGGFEPSSSQDALDEKLGQIHQLPSRDPDRLSPRKDGFDEISMSGSDYSRGTTSAQTPIAMNDNEASNGFITTTTAKTVAEEESQEDDQPGSGKVLSNDNDDFHSMPGTPLDTVHFSRPGLLRDGVGKEEPDWEGERERKRGEGKKETDEEGQEEKARDGKGKVEGELGEKVKGEDFS